MRDYSKISPQFWIGPTGRKLRAAGAEAQIVALYLLTCPSANMLGLYYCPITFIAHETGLGLEGASKGLRSAINAGFCEYDDDSEVVWVIEMASYQLGLLTSEKDLRVKGVQNEYDAIPENPYLAAFFDKYANDFLMQKKRGGESPLEGASKGLASKEKEKEKEKESKPSLSAVPKVDVPAKRDRAIVFDSFVASCKAKGEDVIPESDPVFDWAEKSGVSVDMLRLAWLEFRDRNKGKAKRYIDWRRVFRNACRDNWFRLWHCDPDHGVCLTSQGRLAQKTHHREAA